MQASLQQSTENQNQKSNGKQSSKFIIISSSSNITTTTTIIIITIIIIIIIIITSSSSSSLSSSSSSVPEANLLAAILYVRRNLILDHLANSTLRNTTNLMLNYKFKSDVKKQRPFTSLFCFSFCNYFLS